jgi:hypothetical protein
MKLKIYSDNKTLVKEQNKFIKALEGIGDILVFQTRSRKNKLVLYGLKRYKEILDKFFTLKTKNPEKFDKLLLEQDFLKLYHENQENAKLALFFDPKKYLPSFSTAINQILRIYEEAIASKNEEISRFAVYHLNWLLADISKTSNNGLFVEQLLKHLRDITRIAIENNDVSMYASSIHWYTDIVFNELRQQDEKFDLSYLDLFDKYFFFSAKYIISEDKTSLYQAEKYTRKTFILCCQMLSKYLMVT